MADDVTANLQSIVGGPTFATDFLAIDNSGAAAWAPNTAVTQGTLNTANGNIYSCATPGTTAATGSGPSGTAVAIQDGTVVWSFVRTQGAHWPIGKIAWGARGSAYNIVDDVSGKRLPTKANLAVGGTDVSASNPVPVTLESEIGTLAVTDVAVEQALGTVNDAAWSGTGAASITAALKGIFGQEIPIQNGAAVTPDTAVSPGRQFAIVCTVAGNVQVQLAGGFQFTIPIVVGLTILPWQVVKVISAGTTATATYANLS